MMAVRGLFLSFLLTCCFLASTQTKINHRSEHPVAAVKRDEQLKAHSIQKHSTHLNKPRLIFGHGEKRSDSNNPISSSRNLPISNMSFTTKKSFVQGNKYTGKHFKVKKSFPVSISNTNKDTKKHSEIKKSLPISKSITNKYARKLSKVKKSLPISNKKTARNPPKKKMGKRTSVHKRYYHPGENQYPPNNQQWGIPEPNPYNNFGYNPEPYQNMPYDNNQAAHAYAPEPWNQGNVEPSNVYGYHQPGSWDSNNQQAPSYGQQEPYNPDLTLQNQLVLQDQQGALVSYNNHGQFPAEPLLQNGQMNVPGVDPKSMVLHNGEAVSIYYDKKPPTNEQVQQGAYQSPFEPAPQTNNREQSIEADIYGLQAPDIPKPPTNEQGHQGARQNPFEPAPLTNNREQSIEADIYGLQAPDVPNPPSEHQNPNVPQAYSEPYPQNNYREQSIEADVYGMSAPDIQRPQPNEPGYPNQNAQQVYAAPLPQSHPQEQSIEADIYGMQAPDIQRPPVNEQGYQNQNIQQGYPEQFPQSNPQEQSIEADVYGLQAPDVQRPPSNEQGNQMHNSYSPPQEQSIEADVYGLEAPGNPNPYPNEQQGGNFQQGGSEQNNYREQSIESDIYGLAAPDTPGHGAGGYPPNNYQEQSIAADIYGLGPPRDQRDNLQANKLNRAKPFSGRANGILKHLDKHAPQDYQESNPFEDMKSFRLKLNKVPHKHKKLDKYDHLKGKSTKTNLIYRKKSGIRDSAINFQEAHKNKRIRQNKHKMKNFFSNKRYKSDNDDENEGSITNNRKNEPRMSEMISRFSKDDIRKSGSRDESSGKIDESLNSVDDEETMDDENYSKGKERLKFSSNTNEPENQSTTLVEPSSEHGTVSTSDEDENETNAEMSTFNDLIDNTTLDDDDLELRGSKYDLEYHDLDKEEVANETEINSENGLDKSNDSKKDVQGDEVTENVSKMTDNASESTTDSDKEDADNTPITQSKEESNNTEDKSANETATKEYHKDISHSHKKAVRDNRKFKRFREPRPYVAKHDVKKDIENTESGRKPKHADDEHDSVGGKKSEMHDETAMKKTEEAHQGSPLDEKQKHNEHSGDNGEHEFHKEDSHDEHGGRDEQKIGDKGLASAEQEKRLPDHPIFSSPSSAEGNGDVIYVTVRSTPTVKDINDYVKIEGDEEKGAYIRRRRTHGHLSWFQKRKNGQR